jgi:hypothetical protein
MTSEGNDGKQLEELVAMIEGMSLPPGFKVEIREKIYNDAGQQIAELDILISGQIGSVKYETLLECRDRPSEGPAPASWIEQLLGRKVRFKFSEVIAVSTTGFAPGAVELANKERIPLRTVESLTAESIRGFLPLTAPLWESEANLIDTHIEAIPEDIPLELLAAPHIVVERERLNIPSADKAFLDTETNQYLSLNELWKRIRDTHNREVYGDVPWNWEFVEKRIAARDDFRKRYRVLRDGQRAHLHSMTLTANVRQRMSPMALVQAVKYGGSGAPETVVATWKGNEGDNVKEMVVLLSKKPKQS